MHNAIPVSKTDHSDLCTWYAISGMLRHSEKNSPAKRKSRLKKTCSTYSGSTSGFRLLHWSIGFL